jgi:septum site-determining protein MinC
LQSPSRKTRHKRPRRKEAALRAEPAPAQPEPATLLLESPVRSGQSVVFPHGDITVLGSVASGAEVIAGGSIHIYGTLRGRAFAGSHGNERARIFCNKVEAELLAISGFYRSADDIEARLRSQPIQAWLKGDVMFVAPLN